MELVKSISVANLLNQLDGIRDRLVAAQKILIEADQLCQSASLRSFDRIFSSYRSSSWLQEDAVGKAMKEVEASAWNLLMDESGLKSFMSAKRRKEWSETISEYQFPDMTRETILATFENIHGERGDMFEQGVIECFRRLSWDYKTNEPCRFGKRIIMNYLMTSYGSVCHTSTDQLDDLMRIFHVMDDKPEPDHRNGMYFQIGKEKHQTCCENDYISLKWYKKGTGHVTFKRADLVEKMNGIIAKHHPNILPSRT